MSVDARIETLLTGVPPIERLMLRDVRFVASFFGLSPASIYRHVSDGSLPHVKLPGKDRRTHGRAGAVRFRLVDLVRFAVEREVDTLAVSVPVSAARVEADLTSLVGGPRRGRSLRGARGEP